MSMATIHLILFLVINLVTLSVSQNFPFHTCNNNTNFTINSVYQRNLNNALSSLTSDTSIRSGFYNQSIGENPDQANAIGLCKGDVEPGDCRRCLNDAITQLRQICPNQKGAIWWYDNCMLKYSNVTILGVLDTSVEHAWYLANGGNASNVAQFNQRVYRLLYQLRNDASRGGSLRKYASNSTSGPGFTTLYGLMQCTPDLSENDCYNCLDSAINYVPLCCDNKRGARFYYPSCNMRYEQYRFSIDTVTLEVPSPTQSSTPPPSPSGIPSSKGTSLRVIVGPILAAVAVFLVAVFFIFRRHQKRKRKDDQGGFSDSSPEGSKHHREDDDTGEMNFFNLGIIQIATNNFSLENKLGEGGFGPVYKGKLEDGKEIAVKRLSRNSGQGLLEFKTEVQLIIKLQHKNLVRLLGYCIKRSERLLIYEFMANNSLDTFLFDANKCEKLDWATRTNIVIGIAKGLRYLHEDSRLKIIHRDMKASNILLDNEMNPKISDFGTARIFGGNQMEATTNRIVGTYGYMAPEYAMEGLFSTKSDVYSFGVLLLEIVAGQRNNKFSYQDQPQNFLSTALRLWKENKGEQLIDSRIIQNFSIDEALRWINIALLCVQEDPHDRPTMSTVVFMLEGQWYANLPEPSEPPVSFARFEIVVSEQTTTIGDQTEYLSASVNVNMCVAT